MIRLFAIVIAITFLAIVALAACIVGARKDREADKHSIMPGRKRP